MFLLFSLVLNNLKNYGRRHSKIFNDILKIFIPDRNFDIQHRNFDHALHNTNIPMNYMNSSDVK